MKAFQIGQIPGYVIVAKDYATAEKLWIEKYKTTPLVIQVVADYVIVEKEEKP